MPAPTTSETSPFEIADLASRYALSNEFAITTASLSPEPAYQLLRDLSSDPGRALITLADAAGVPAAEQLFAALPNSLEGKLAQWMSDAIGSSADLQVLVAWSQLVLAEVEVESTLEIVAIDAQGVASATHTLNSFVFHVDGLALEEAIPQISALPGAGHAELKLHAFADTQGSAIALEEHSFGLLFGEAAYRAFESAIAVRFGTDLRGVLGAAIDCPSMASEVAGRCVLGVCVGHPSQLSALCEGALDSAAAKIYEQFAALDAEVLRLQAGSARVVSSEGGTQLVDGLWQAQAELGQGLRSLPARFSGDSL